MTAPAHLAPMRGALSLTLEVLGLGLVVAGAYTLAPWIGLVVAGIGLAAAGFLLEPPRRRPDEAES